MEKIRTELKKVQTKHKSTIRNEVKRIRGKIDNQFPSTLSNNREEQCAVAFAIM